MRLIFKVALIGALVGLLVLIRMFEYRFFYDPFMYFFEQAFRDGTQLEIPGEYYFNVFLRFVLNTLISLLILFITFQSKGMVKFAVLIYVGFFTVLFPLFIYLMHHVQPEDYLAAFYVRRFLVHPVLILILLPAFYYYKLKNATNSADVHDN